MMLCPSSADSPLGLSVSEGFHPFLSGTPRETHSDVTVGWNVGGVVRDTPRCSNPS